MKKNILFVTAFFLSISIIAQEKALKQYGFWDNWFLQAQVGASYTFSENTKNAAFLKQLAPQDAISFGKFFSPVSGARVNVSGWESKNYLYDIRRAYRVKYFQANFDGILSLTNLFIPYNQDRKFSLNAIMGLGYMHRFGNNNTIIHGTQEEPKVLDITHHNYLVPRAGLQADLRVRDAVSLNLEAIGNFVRDDFNGQTGGHEFDIPVNLMVGITYRFNNRGFEQVDVFDPAQIASLNSSINSLRQQVSERDQQIGNLQSELARRPESVTVVKTVTPPPPNTTFQSVIAFRIGSAEIDDNQKVSIYHAARYLKDKPTVNVIVTGYADRDTGTPQYNQNLSERRAKAVADTLIREHGIDASRVSIFAKGDIVQPFGNNDWNRAVILIAE